MRHIRQIPKNETDESGVKWVEYKKLDLAQIGIVVLGTLPSGDLVVDVSSMSDEWPGESIVRGPIWRIAKRLPKPLEDIVFPKYGKRPSDGLEDWKPEDDQRERRPAHRWLGEPDRREQ